MDMVLVDGWICHGSVLFFKWGRDTGGKDVYGWRWCGWNGIRNVDAMAVWQMLSMEFEFEVVKQEHMEHTSLVRTKLHGKKMSCFAALIRWHVVGILPLVLLVMQWFWMEVGGYVLGALWGVWFVMGQLVVTVQIQMGAWYVDLS